MLTQVAPMLTVVTPIERLGSTTATGVVLLALLPLLVLNLLAPQNLFTLHLAQAMRLLTVPQCLVLIRGDCKNLS
jgi:hypothetical protein